MIACRGSVPVDIPSRQSRPVSGVPFTTTGPGSRCGTRSPPIGLMLWQSMRRSVWVILAASRPMNTCTMPGCRYRKLLPSSNANGANSPTSLRVSAKACAACRYRGSSGPWAGATAAGAVLSAGEDAVMAAEDWLEAWLDCNGWVEDEWEEERADEAEKEHRRTCRGSRVDRKSTRLN